MSEQALPQDSSTLFDKKRDSDQPRLERYLP